MYTLCVPESPYNLIVLLFILLSIVFLLLFVIQCKICFIFSTLDDPKISRLTSDGENETLLAHMLVAPIFSVQSLTFWGLHDTYVIYNCNIRCFFFPVCVK